MTTCWDSGNCYIRHDEHEQEHEEKVILMRTRKLDGLKVVKMHTHLQVVQCKYVNECTQIYNTARSVQTLYSMLMIQII